MPVSYKDFAADIKAKYPVYSDLDDLEPSGDVEFGIVHHSHLGIELDVGAAARHVG